MIYRLTQMGKYLYLLIGSILIIGPLYLSIINAMKTTQELSKSFFALPENLNFTNFIKVINTSNYFQYLTNSLFITIIGVILILIVAPLISFSIARNMDKNKYYKFLFYFILLGIFVPFQVKMVPIVKLLSDLGLMNHTGLILLYVAGALTQDVFLLVGYIKTLPIEIEEAAEIDGCSRIQTITKITYPLMKPILATIIIKDALWIWNDFQMPLIVLSAAPDKWTLPMFVYNFQSTYSVDFTMAFAAFVLALLPVLILYMIMRKRIMGGLTTGAVK
ncbi:MULTISPECIES: carbohydrate ABC transporter permease [Mesobacillus]|uniref:Sugar ABC transporter permease n=2 Tax=Mesobacillus TaxID=2675231 RepID=A0A0D6ZES1_9BACI|nr:MULTISPECIES: carbohydrate ABC transporter permease [Mesobacillus]KIY23113.1 sugar ABC transporter permease [Mesobacillus subterraneus]MDQ0415299.1 raffinose/stachyose/melibiose transport system permease protein [Mesobacillus stamsii]